MSHQQFQEMVQATYAQQTWQQVWTLEKSYIDPRMKDNWVINVFMNKIFLGRNSRIES